jgi:hypothetical protein
MEVVEFTGDAMKVIKTNHADSEQCGYAYQRRRIDVTIPAETDLVPLDRSQLVYVLPSPLLEGEWVSNRADAKMIELSELSPYTGG